MTVLDPDWDHFDKEYLAYRGRCKRFWKLEVTSCRGVSIVNDFSEIIFHPKALARSLRPGAMDRFLELADFSFLKPPKTGFFTPDQAFAQHIYGSPQKEDVIKEQLDNCFEEDLGLIG